MRPIALNPKPDASHTRAAAQIAVTYALAAAAWIVGSDVVVDALVPDHLQLTGLQTAKGLAFVGLTAYILFVLIRRRLARESGLNRNIAEAEHALRAVMDQATTGIYVLQDGRIAFANDYFASSLGYANGGALTGADPVSLVAPPDRERVAANIRERLGGGAVESRYAFTALRSDGSEVAVGVHATLVTFKGRPAILGFAQDITETLKHEREIQTYIARLEKAMQSTIGVVSKMGGVRDPYTHGHERRVGEIGAAIAREMGFADDDVEGVRVAGHLHDVGKIAIPADILAKPTKLSAVEFTLVKDHAAHGREILSGLEFPWPIAESAWQHHERLDGSGYPRGLKDAQIIPFARILAVADTIEAMISHRPWRPALSIDEAFAEIEQGRGTLFDTQVVDASLRLFREKGYRPED